MTQGMNWDRLRFHQNSLEASFEELCCLLAKHPEDRKKRLAKGWTYFRKGAPDAGCECTWTLRDGTVHGWQAKFFRGRIAESQWKQLDDWLSAILS